MSDKPVRIVSNWILLGIFMLVVQVLLGGITRLTGSGLSITEWKPIMGALPPLSEQDWQNAFTKYQQIAQYKYLNTHFSLSDFKFIFFWEWFHRLWARLIGVVFLIPFIYFIVRKYIKQWMIAPLVILFVLGAMQGAVGWLMVKSGLNENDLYVSHIRLAAHFIAAMILIGYALIFWIKLKVDQRERVASVGLKNGAIAILTLLVIQLIYGAFMAGLKAAAVASTWPTINGDWLPPNAFSGNLSTDLFHNKITIHFIHRNLAYLVSLLIIGWWWASRKAGYSRAFSFARNTTVVLVFVQVLLGVLAVLNSQHITPGRFGVFEWMAQLHQLTGMLLFLSLTAVVYLTTWKKAAVPVSRQRVMPLA
ncbi:heme A synthase [Segetibacter sp. 3557_3]|uniref:COX15/CtaA family protein n=1 Tax=Segetibacter sp. 3557_3 TaxID=2547429 RepID=UPI001058584D|nr:COX15/CtaA family protein [Segetibacter sp. 3557_3]TDH20857.1 heme A synthase [Segetibacter sp. 3557_3]